MADFVGNANFLVADVAEFPDSETMVLSTGAGTIRTASAPGLKKGDEVTLSIRPENIRVSRDPLDGANVMDGSVEQVVFLGDAVDCRVHVGEVSLVSRQHPSVLVERGDSVKVQLPPELCTLVTEHGVHGTDAATSPGAGTALGVAT